jgi:ABC-type transport system involved in Fe-S cluster assembly fused permease/ATPase subunit
MHYFCKVYHPGGVKHAVQQSSSSEDEDAKAPKSDMDISRATVDVEVRSLGFKWVRSSLGPFSPRIEKPILDNINVKFPLGKVTAIIVSIPV